MQKLTQRERQIASLVTTGIKNRLIAEKLQISEQTVKNHLRSVFAKARVQNRLQLSLWMLRSKELSPVERG